MKMMKERVISLLLAICLLPGLAPTAVRAENTAENDEPMAIAAESGITYLDWDDGQKELVESTCASATTVESTTTEWNNGWYVVSGSVTIESRITVTGEVHLILEDGFTLTASKGIEVSEGNSLTIYGQSGQTGALNATADSYNAGIGSTRKVAFGTAASNAGTVTINGGNVTARGSNNGAGIGGGESGAGGTVTINGGEVTATGGSNGAGIGGGRYGAGGSVTITGGAVNATGGSSGAGIGGADGGAGGTVTITGGTVTATGSNSGAGIGGGSNGTGGTVTIHGGTVTAIGGASGAGIGGGSNGAGGDVTIDGGTVTAKATGHSAGIGGGYNGAGGTVTITGGTVTATGNGDGAGIGGGSKGDGGTVIINGGTVNVTGGPNGAGIGGGKDSNADGSFSTGTDCNAVIFTSSQFRESIADTSRQDSWSGIIFNGNTGEIYGTPTPEHDFEIPSSKTLNVKNGHPLHITTGVTMTNSGTVNIGNGDDLSAILNNEGTIVNRKKIEVWGTLTEGESRITNQNGGEIIYHFNLEVTPPTFAEARSGYSRPEARSITITSTDDVPATIVSVSISGDDFELNGGEKAELAKDASNTSWKIQPKAGLSLGTHTATITVTYSGSHGAPNKTATATVTFTVREATPTFTPPTVNTLTYTGAPQQLVTAGSAVGGTMWYAVGDAAPSDESQWKTDVAEITGTNAGDYTVWYKVVGDADHTDTEPAYVTVTIDKAAAAVTEPTAKTPLTYTGADQALVTAGSVTSTVAGYGTMQYSLTEGSDYSDAIPTGKDAGTYTVYWKIDGANETNYNYNGEISGNFTVTIAQAAATVTPPTTSALTYNGEEQELVTKGSVTGGEMLYSLEQTGSYSATIPTKKNAGTYNVWYKVVGDANHKGTEPVEVTVTIARATATVTLPAPKELTYTGAEQQLVTEGRVTSDVEGCGTMQYSLTDGSDYSDAIPTGKDAETYTVYWKIDGADETNYNYVGGISGEVHVTIGKSDADVTGNSVAITYGEDVTLKVDVALKPTNGIALTSVAQNQVEFVFPKGDPQTATVDKSSGENGTATLTIRANEVKNYLEPGTNTVTVNYGGSENLNGKNSVTMTVTVNQKALDFTFAATDKVYDGSNVVTGSLTPTELVGSDVVTATLQTGAATAASADAGTQNVTVDTTQITLGGADAEYYSLGTVTGGTVTISKAAAAVVTAPTAKTLTYNGETQELVNAGTPTGGEMQYSLDNTTYSADIPTGIEAKEYTVWYKVVGNANHTDTEPQSVNVTIQKADSTLTVDGSTVTYGDTITLVAEVARNNTSGILLAAVDMDTVVFTLNGTSLGSVDVIYSNSSHDSGTATLKVSADKRFAIGANTIRAEYGGSVNLNGSKNNSITVTVNKRTLTPSVAADKVPGGVYDGTTYSHASVEGEIVLDGAVFDEAPTAHGQVAFVTKDAGTDKPVDVTGIALDSGWGTYYELSTAVLTNAPTDADVTPKELTFEWHISEGGKDVLDPDALYYTRDAYNVTATATNLVADDTCALTVGENGAQTNAGTYTAKITSIGNSNYVLPENITLEYTIRKAPVNFTVTDTEYTYDGAAHTATVEQNAALPHTLTATASGGPVFTVAYGGAANQTNAGTYDIVVTLTDPANFEFAGGGDSQNAGTLTINRAPVTFAVDPEVKPVHDWTAEVNKDPNPAGYVISEGTDRGFALAMTYDSLEHTANVRQDSGVAMGGMFSVSYKRVKDAAGNAVTEAAAETFRAAGTYEIWVTLTDNPENFMFEGETPTVRTLCIGTVRVKPYDVRVTWQNLTFVYHGHKMHPTVRVENAFLADEQPDESEKQNFMGDLTAFDGDLMAYAVTDSADAKGYTVTVTLYGSEAGNYTVSNPTADVVIQPAPVVFEVTNNEWLYNEKARERDVTLTAAWGEVTNSPDTVQGDSYPGAGTGITLDVLGVTAADIEYRLENGTVLDDPTETGTYQVCVRIPNANFRHAGSSGGDFHNVGVLRIAENDHPATYTVTFDPGRDEQGNRFDGVTVPEPMENLIPTQEITLPTAPKNAPAGYAFAGWSRSGALYQPGEEFYMPYSDVTFEAKWTKAVFSISGVVIDDEEEHVPYVSVTLMMGEHQIGLTTTDENGIFRFYGLIPNTYNLVFTWNGIVKTYMVEIVDKDVEDGTYALPGYRLNTVVEVAPGSGSVVVDLDPIITDSEASDLYGDDEKKLVENGGTVEFKMKVEDSSAAAGMTEKLKDVPVSAENIGMVLDMNLTKTVTEAGTAAKPTVTQIKDSKALIANLIYLPAELQGKDGYTVYRFHDGVDEVQTITTVPNEDGERIEIVKDGAAIMVYARYYSTYVLTWYQQNTQVRGTIVVPATPHGTVTPDVQSAVPGSKVTLVVRPDEGCELEMLTVTDSQGQEIFLTDNGDGTYSFVMPAANVVTVHAAFRECPSLRFPDLDVTKWYHRFTDYVIARAVMNGYDTGLFVPEGNVTRAEMVTVLWNMADHAESDAEMQYSDVMGDAWYCEAIRWAAEAGVANGYGDGTFRPDREITREEMAAMLYRYEKNVMKIAVEGDLSGELDFPDKETTHNWALEAMIWCAENGLFEGDDAGLLRPGDVAERAALAKILTACMELGEES